MIKRILIVVGIVFVIGLLVLWFIRGGPQADLRTAASFSNPIALIFGSSTSTGSLQLPWQPAELTRGPDISDYVNSVGQGSEQTQTSQSQQSSQSEDFGNPSPYEGEVRLSLGGARAGNVAEEYVELNASGGISPIVISGWSLQSAITGVRVYIPEAAAMFVMGIVNNVGPVALQGGDSAIINSGASPVGVSFRENICSGYAGQIRQFVPQITERCPAPSDMLPETASNLSSYGTSCFDYVANLQQCSLPGTLPSNLSANCQAYVENIFSYNGCVNMYSAQSSFSLPVWRIFLDHTTEMWNNDHDVIRVLDAQGRTVDVLTY